MSYGFVLTDALLPDDIVGASLLRPVDGWREGVGSLGGRVTVAGEPARFVPVRSARLAGGDAAPAPAVFTDERGRFTIEGLVPGDYLLAAGPFTSVGRTGICWTGAPCWTPRTECCWNR